MKPPKLPGTEKFKFSDKKFEELCKNSSNTINTTNNNNNNNNSFTTITKSSNFIRGVSSRNTCPANCLTNYTNGQSSPFVRYESIRKPILPITSRMSSTVLKLSHLPINSMDMRCTNTFDLNKNFGKLSITCDSRLSKTNTGSRMSLISTFSMSSESSSSSTARLSRRQDCPTNPLKWTKYNHRLSTSSESSCGTNYSCDSSD
ncbi:uncharacterized protein LOC128964724 [Oppia nitens]|uniref:uncharacterized protein LOC128964724 n=1 Tax=Oppia nitens TaxID=1686743 RepID=UPI0023DC539B|nr:uncharacterized protein LOC128964724 [Oppia nitens]